MSDVTLPRQHTTITTMAAARGNGPLEPHRMPCVPVRRVPMIKEDPPIKRICFWWGFIGYGPQNARFVAAMMRRDKVGAF